MKYTVLVVDDDPSSIRILSYLLKEDYNLITANNGPAAVSAAQEQLPDLILLDIIIPGINGFDVLKTLKHDTRTQQIPVMFITGLDSSEDEEQGLKLGAVDYIHKPFHHGIIKARVKNHLDSSRQRKLLEELAHIDVLTELPNRRKWKVDAEAVWKASLVSGDVLAVGILDIDHFKDYNDYYGHSMGDAALVTITQIVQQQLEDVNGNLYRFGGEEFMFVISAENLDTMQPCLEGLCKAIEDAEVQHWHSPVAKVITASVGVCAQPASEGNSIKRMLERADEILYQAKRSGKNRLLITETFVEKRKSAE
jgi:diguanylate cyclase (GGDEF)-like protein